MRQEFEMRSLFESDKVKQNGLAEFFACSKRAFQSNPLLQKPAGAED